MHTKYVKNKPKHQQKIASCKFLNKLVGPKIKVFPAYQTRKTSSFFPNKDKVPISLASNLVYQYICEECRGSSYTGETVRHLSTRIREHCSGKPIPSELSLHNHTIKANNFKIILRTQYTKIAETLVINDVPLNKRLNDMSTSTPIKLFTLN